MIYRSSYLKDDLLRNGCSNFYNNTALGLFEVAPTVGFEEIDEVITALHTSNSNREGGLFNYIVWNMHWNEKLSNKSIRISLLYGKDANRRNHDQS